MSNPRTIYFILHSRYPAEKAASLFAAKSCEAFADAGERVVLLVPQRFDRAKRDSYEYYGVKKNFATVYLPVLDLFPIPMVKAVAFYVSFITFSLAVLAYLVTHARRTDIVYTNESLTLMLASLVSMNTLYEMHDFPERKLWFYRLMLARTRWLLVTNSWKVARLTELFPHHKAQVVLEQNAVDLSEFPLIDKREARIKLGVPDEVPIVVYTGHLYAWKGVDTLADAARKLPDGTLVYFVGGTESDQKRFGEAYKDVANIRLAGHKPHAEIPHWQAIADVLVLPNTAKESISKYYTSPMKLFEYMASGRPIVASDLPSVRELLNEHNALLVPPDDADALATGIARMLTNTEEAHTLATRARADVEAHTWSKRAERILAHMQ